MKYITILFISLFLVSCSESKSGNGKLLLDEMLEEELFSNNHNLDSVKYLKSKAVIKGKLIKFGSGNKYLYPKIQILDVLMNKTDFNFKDTITVAHYNWKSGVPQNKECIIYLTPWPLESEELNEKRNWMLIEGDGEYACECK